MGAKARDESATKARADAFVRGEITLGELVGVGKPRQVAAARKAHALFRAGKLGEAEKLFQSLVALDPYDGYFHTALGACFQRGRRFAEAAREYARALEIDRDNGPALVNRGECLLELGMVEKGLAELGRAAAVTHRDAAPWSKRARALLAAARRRAEAVR
jgi:Flp pilus assembly protein TadD